MRDWSPIDVLPDILMDVPDLVFVYTRDARYVFVNTAAAEFLGVDPMEVVGFHWNDFGFPPEIMMPLSRRVEEVAATGEAEHYRFVSSPMKGLRTFDMSLTPLWSEEGHVLAVLAIAHDVSEFFGHATLS